MKYNVATIEEYLEAVPSDRKEIIQRIIHLVHEYFPDIIGNMEYNMPTFNPVCAIASQKHYISLYIHQINLVEKYRNELVNLKVGRSCIRFKKPEEYPEKTIQKIFKEIRDSKNF